MSILSENDVRLIQEYPLAQLIVVNEENNLAELSAIPILLEPSRLRLIGHLANNNPVAVLLKKCITGSDNVALKQVQFVFTGANGYISPRWHIEQQVPTWNYQTVQIVAEVRLVESTEDKLKSVEDMSTCFDPTWSMAKFKRNVNQVNAMLSAISVFEFDVIQTHSKYKLSQNRSPECRAAFKQALIEQGNFALAHAKI
jgi:transcriptional regulator